MSILLAVGLKAGIDVASTLLGLGSISMGPAEGILKCTTGLLEIVQGQSATEKKTFCTALENAVDAELKKHPLSKDERELVLRAFRDVPRQFLNSQAADFHSHQAFDPDREYLVVRAFAEKDRDFAEFRRAHHRLSEIALDLIRIHLKTLSTCPGWQREQALEFRRYVASELNNVQRQQAEYLPLLTGIRSLLEDLLERSPAPVATQPGFESEAVVVRDLQGNVVQLVNLRQGGGLLFGLDLPPTPAPGTWNPTWLLTYKYRVQPLISRETEVEDLSTWIQETAAPVPRVRVYHAEGGHGKSRLWLEACLWAQGQGWQAGFVDRLMNYADPLELRERVAQWLREMEATLAQRAGNTPDAGILAVFDYIEESTPLLLEVLRQLQRSERPWRLVCLSRSASWEGGWLRNLKDRDREGLIRPWQAAAGRGMIELCHLESVSVDRTTAFVTAVEAFRRCDNPTAVGSSTVVPDYLQTPSFERILILHIAAMVAAYNEPDRPTTELEALKWVTNREKQYLRDLLSDDDEKLLGLDANAEKKTNVPRRLNVLLGALILGVTPETPDDQSAVIQAAGFTDEAAQETAQYLMDQAYGWKSLQPDLVAEHWVSQLRPREVARLLDVLRACREQVDWSVGPVVLNRLYKRTGSSTLLDDFVKTFPCEVAWGGVGQGERLWTGQGRGLRLAEANPHLLRLLEEVLPSQPDSGRLLGQFDRIYRDGGMDLGNSIPLRPLALTLTLADLDRRGVPGADPNEVANLLSRLSRRYYDIGRFGEGLNAATRVVEFYRNKVDDSSITFLSGLADGLSRQAQGYSFLGRHLEAVSHTQQAIDLYRPLAQKDPDEFTIKLAGNLSQLGVMFSKLGHHQEDLNVTQQAVDLYRLLAQKNPGAFTADLARTLGNMGVTYSNLGRHQESLDVTRQVVDLYRPLAQENPGTFIDSLALNLGNLGIKYRNLNRHLEAVDHIQQAIDLYRPLAQEYPGAFTADLARNLGNLGTTYGELGRHLEAVDYIQQAIDLYRPLAQEYPGAFTADLARNLGNLGATYSHLGRDQEDLDITRQAVDLYRSLARENPGVFTAELARNLGNLGVTYYNLGHYLEAGDNMHQAVDLFRPLAQENPDAFTTTLSRLLYYLDNSRMRTGPSVQSVAVDERYPEREDAVTQYRTLARENPSAFNGDLADSLISLSTSYSNLGRHEEAVAAAKEAVELYRTIAQDNFEEFKSSLVGGLRRLGVCYANVGRRKEALEAMAEARKV